MPVQRETGQTVVGNTLSRWPALHVCISGARVWCNGRQHTSSCRMLNRQKLMLWPTTPVHRFTNTRSAWIHYALLC